MEMQQQDENDNIFGSRESNNPNIASNPNMQNGGPPLLPNNNPM